MRRTSALRLFLFCDIFLAFQTSDALAVRDVGIDVSHYQGSINWTSVAGAGKDFAWAKADEGATNTFNDSTFTTNMINGKNAGVYMGAYHFARPETNSDATVEAQHFLNVIQPNGPNGSNNYLGVGYFRPMLDIETDGVATTAGRTYLSNWINTFCDYIVSHGGGARVEPLVYMNSNYASNYVNSTVATRDLDVADYLSGTNPPAPTGSPPAGIGVWSTWAFWQYSSSGAVSGISGNVDMDVANGDINFVKQFVIGGFAERFDVNGTTGGSGVTNNGSYTWEAAGYSSASDGTDPVSWIDGNFLRLAAGTDAGASNYTITANSNHTFAGMILQTGGGGTVTINGPGVLSIASGDQGMFVDTSTQNLKINASLAGTGRLVWQGSSTGSGGGSLYLLGNNTYTGGTLLNTSSGLNFNNNNSFGTGPITWGVAQQVLAAPTATAPINIGNAMMTRSASTLVMASFAQPVTFSGGWTLATGISTLDVRSGVDTTISGNISGTDGTSALTKISPGKLTLSGTNTYTGGTTISAGALQLGNAGTTGKLSTSSAIINNSSLIFNRTNTVTQGTDFTGSAISGTGSLTQAGSGTLILNAANTYAGKTFANAGTLSISADGNLGTAPGSSVADQLTFNGGALKVTAGFAMNSRRGITINSPGGTFSIISGSLGVASTITNTSGSTVTITGGGDFNPSANNSTTFTNGKWYITGGSRWLNANNDNNSGAAAAPVADFFTFDNGTYVNNSGHTLNDNKGITLAAGGGTIDTTNGAMTFNGVITGPGSLTKLNANTLTLGGANTYAGTTTVSGGALIVSAASATLGAGNVSVLGSTAGTSLVIQSGVGNAINDSAMLSLAGGGTVDVADQGYANFGSGIAEIVGSLLLGGVAQAQGLTYGSTLSGAAVQSDEYFTGTGTVSIGLPGDFNGDGSVDAGDYLGWRKSQSTFGGSAGYDLWRSNFGTTSPGSGSSGSLSAQTAAPEPGAMILTIIAGAVLTMVHGKRRTTVRIP